MWYLYMVHVVSKRINYDCLYGKNVISLLGQCGILLGNDKCSILIGYMWNYK